MLPKKDMGVSCFYESAEAGEGNVSCFFINRIAATQRRKQYVVSRMSAFASTKTRGKKEE